MVQRPNVLLVASSLIACVPSSDRPHSGRLGIEVPEVEESSPLALSFEEAAADTGVPADVLEALAYVETQLVAAEGDVEFEGQEAPYGLFALSGERLARAAQLAGLTVEDVKRDRDAGVLAAAWLLRSLGDEVGAGEDPMSWGPALERWRTLEDDLAAGFARDVLGHVARGAAIPLEDGTTLVIGRNANEEIGSGERGLGASNVVWRPSPNHSSRNGTSVELVVIHTCEGAYSGCVSHLRNSSSGVSAHYVVKEDGSEVSHLVDENRKAWHIAASYRPNLNSGQLSHRSGQSTNNFSVGIEHGGSARQSSFPVGQIDRSIALVRDITSNHNIPRDRYHIVGHGQLQPENRTDPGPNWPWASYLAAIASGGSGGGGGGSMTPPPPNATIVVVDNATPGRFRASGSWARSTWASGRVGSDYLFRDPEFTSDPAAFKVAVPSAGNWEVFVRSPGNGYNNHVPYLIHHRGGTSVVHRDTARAGASWVSLGTYAFDAVDDYIVEISCWTSGSGYIIADAVKIEQR